MIGVRSMPHMSRVPGGAARQRRHHGHFCHHGRRRRIIAALTLLLVGISVLSPSSSGATTSSGSVAAPRRVLVVTVPRVTWATIREQRPPNLVRFLNRAAVASMSTRTVGPRTDGADAYLTLGAGNRADALNPLTAGDAAQLAETETNGSAAEVYRRRTGIQPTGDIVVLSIAEQIARNDALLYGAARERSRPRSPQRGT